MLDVREEKQLKQHAARGASIAKPALLPIFAVQGAVLLLASVGLLFVDITLAYSVLLGGLISILPNIYFARWAFRFSGAQAAAEVARSFYRGEAGKFVLTVCLFAGVFNAVKPLAIEAFFLTYIFMMVLNWFLALRLSKRR